MNKNTDSFAEVLGSFYARLPQWGLRGWGFVLGLILCLLSIPLESFSLLGFGIGLVWMIFMSFIILGE